jgi:subtilisin family serine protease
MSCLGRKQQRESVALPTIIKNSPRHILRQRILIVIAAFLLTGSFWFPLSAHCKVISSFIPSAHGGKASSFLPSAAARENLKSIIHNMSSTKSVQEKVNPRIAVSLQHRIDKKSSANTRAKMSGQTSVQDKIKVMFQLAEGATLDPQAVTSRGGNVLRQEKKMIAVEIPPDHIESLVQAEHGILLARSPRKFRPLGTVTSEGINLTGALGFHNIGYRGAGVRVAVVDVGFKGLTASKAAGHLPANVITKDLTGKGLETQYLHGTACAEIVHEMAPDAELHLVKIADEEDFYEVRDYCLQKHIDIVSLSLGSFGTGPGNGTGFLDEICDEIRANGTLIVAAAGNEAAVTDINDYGDTFVYGPHWKGTFTNSDGDNYHEFIPGNDGGILIAALPAFNDDGNGEDDEVHIIMRWNDSWSGATVDYDLILFSCTLEDGEWVCNDEPAGISVGNQNGSQTPTEEIIIDLPDTPDDLRYYFLYVSRYKNSPAGREIEISLSEGNSNFLSYPDKGYPVPTSASSIGEPADAASVFTVGAIDQAQWSTGPQEEFSSQGPTNAWNGSAARIKPDICGPDGVSSYSYGEFFREHDPEYYAENGDSFYGTSSATPHVAGAAALLQSVNKNLSPAEIQSYLQSWAVDMGTSGKDNLYGYGRLRLRESEVTPELTPLSDKTIHEGQRLNFVIPNTGKPWDNQTLEAFPLPDGATYNASTRTFSWQPSYLQEGEYTVTFRTSSYGSILRPYGYSVNIEVFDTPLKGDLNDSSTVDLADAIIAQRVLARQDVAESLRSDYVTSGVDVNGDNKIGLQEAVWILQTLANLR